MAFAAVYVSNFMVQSIVRAEPDLRDRAVALVEGSPPLSKIIAANEAALRAGIKLGMAALQAAEFHKVELRPRSQEQERTAHAALLDVGWSVSPRVEDTALDIIVLDIAGLAKLFGSVKALAKGLAERVSSVGLQPNIAVASTIEVAILAARGFTGITLIPFGEESKRLNSLTIEVLSPSIETLETLHRWGIRTFAMLGGLPVLQLSERLGQEGVRLHQLARGEYCRALLLAEPETCFTEEMALDYAITELEPLAFLLFRLLEQLCVRLEVRALAASAFCLRFYLQDSVTEEPQIRSRTSTSMINFRTYEKILSLPIPMRDPKTLLKLIRLQLQSDPPHGSIIKIILTAEPARLRVGQKGLFIPDSPDPEKLEVTIARLAGLVGNSNVGSPWLIDTHRPGEFRMSPFIPATEESTFPQKPNASKPDGGIYESHSCRAAIAFRIFRPEFPANVESREGCPWRICFRGLYGNVVAASGPWRTSGDWWEKHGWRQDEWDVEIQFNLSGHKPGADLNAQNGLYRIYYDWMRRDWFVRGKYD